MSRKNPPPVVALDLGIAEIERLEVQEFRKHIYIHKLSIFPLFQGHGIGSRVLTKLKHCGKRLTLIAFPDDPERFDELVRFYERHGFHQRDGEDYMVWP